MNNADPANTLVFLSHSAPEEGPSLSEVCNAWDYFESLKLETLAKQFGRSCEAYIQLLAARSPDHAMGIALAGIRILRG